MIDATKTIERAKRLLGAPISSVELEHDQMISLLKNARETFFLYSELSDMTEEKINIIEDAWTTKYFYALCKETLARIRGKFSGTMPIPEADLKLEYENLQEEAASEKRFLQYVIFKEKEILSEIEKSDIILVFYLNIGNLDNQDKEIYIKEISQKLKKPGFTQYFIPVRSAQETRVECIYPSSVNSSNNNVIKELEGFLNEIKLSDGIVGKKISLDLGSNPVDTEILSVNENSVTVKYLNSSPGRVEDFSISDFEILSGIKIQSNEK